MLVTLENIFYTPGYLLRMLRHYLKDHTLLYETREGQHRMKATLRAAQGLILVPNVWNALYDSLLRLEMPNESHLVGYADGVAALVTARTVEQAGRTLEMVIR